MNHFLKVVVVILLTLVTSCASFTRPISVNQKPDPNFGYIFGKFSLTETVGDMAIALVIKNLDNNKTYQIRLIYSKDDIYAISVIPGEYSITKILYCYAFGEIGKESDFSPNNPKLNSSFKVKQNDLLYIGDYIGSINYNWGIYSLRINNISDNYDETLSKFIQKYENFRSLNSTSIFK